MKLRKKLRTRRSQGSAPRPPKRRKTRIERLEARHLLAVTFEFNFQQDGAIGFNDPELGTSRQSALIDTANDFGRLFNHTARIEVDVFNTTGEQQGAFVTPVFDETNAPVSGFFSPIIPQKILDGVDANGSESDGELTLIWDLTRGGGFEFELGDDVEVGEIDFQTVVVHELIHLVGVTSDIFADGSSASDEDVGVPTLWTPYDQFLADESGQRFIDPQTFVIDANRWSDASVNERLFFTGPHAVAANGGNPVAIHAPAEFAEGSSAVHLRIDPPKVTDATHLLLPEVRDGAIARRLHPVTVGILKDLGYDFSQPDPEILVSQSDGSTVLPSQGTTDTFEVSLAVRPPTDVAISIESIDFENVAVTTGTVTLGSEAILNFTPVNWNIPQTVTLTAKQAFTDTQTVLVSVDSSSDPLYVQTFDIAQAVVDVLPGPTQSLLDGVVTGGDGLIRVIGADYDPFAPFDGYTGEIRVASADFNGDGIPDIVAGTGPGAISRVKIFDGSDGSTVLGDITPFPNYLGGVFVAAGDVTGDGIVDLVVGPDQGSIPIVTIYDTPSILSATPRQFFAFDSGFMGGVRVATGDVTGDGIADVIVGGGPAVRAFDVTDGESLVQDFFAFDPSFLDGIHVAAGDQNGDGTADIVVGADAGGGPHVIVFDGTEPSNQLASFFPYQTTFTGGVRVAARDLNSDGGAEIMTGPGGGGIASVLAFGSTALDLIATETPFGTAVSNGVYVAASVPTSPKPSIEFTPILSGGPAATVTITFSEDVTEFSENDITINPSSDITLQPIDASTYTFVLALSGTESPTIEIPAGAAFDAEGTPSLAADPVTVVFDTTSPKVAINSPSTDPTNADAIPIIVSFDEEVESIDSTQFVATGGTIANFDSTGTQVTFDIVPDGDGTISLNVDEGAANDLSGNPSEASGPFEITSDRAAPTATITSTKSNPTNAETIDVEILFSEDVIDFLEGDLTITGGSISEFESTPAATTFTITPTGDGEVRVNLPAESFEDIVGNFNESATAFEITSDRTAPTATITSTQSNPTNAETIPVTVTFSEPVEEIDLTDLTISGGTVSELVRDGDLIYTLDVTPTGELVSVQLAGNVTSDSAGNANEVAEFSISVVPNLEIDLTLSLAASPDSPVAGGVLAYVLTVENQGPDMAPMVEFTGSISSALSFLELSSSSDFSVDGESLSGSFGDIASGETATRVISFTIDPVTAAGTSIELIGSAESLGDDVNETQPEDNDAAVTSTMTTAADVSVQVTARAEAFRVGQLVTYNLEVRNNGPSPATDVTIEHILPASVDFSSRSDSRATNEGSTVTIPLGNLESGSSTRVVVIGRMSEAGEFESSTSVSTATTDRNPSNNSAMQLINVRTLSSPLAGDDAFIAQVDTDLPITPTKLLANDTGAILLSNLSEPENGSIRYSDARNAFVYTPDPGFVGEDTLTYDIQSPLQTPQTLGITDAEGNAVQLEINSASISFSRQPGNDLNVSGFSIEIDRTGSTSAILSTLANGNVLPQVTLSTRTNPSAELAARETVRWTLTNARIREFSTADISETDLHSLPESHTIEFEKIEMDSVKTLLQNAPEKIGPRVHVGFDLDAQKPFKSTPFTSLPVEITEDSEIRKAITNKKSGTYLEVKQKNSLKATLVLSASLQLSNSSESTQPSVSAESGLITIEIDDHEAAATYLDSLLKETTIDQIDLTQINSKEGGGHPIRITKRMMKGVSVESVEAQLSTLDGEHGLPSHLPLPTTRNTRGISTSIST